MSKYKYTAVKGTAGNLFSRMAFDEVDNTTEFAQHVLDFVHNKISEQDYAQLKKMLQGEATEEESDAPIKGAMDARRVAPSSTRDFESRFPATKHLGRDDMIGRR
jgi:2,3-bisphosphoglycerate-independent phosphoglycerate mutase